MEERLSLRQRNLEAFKIRPVDPTSFAKLDGSIKKNTAFIKKLKAGITSTQLPVIIKELQTLKLEKYIEEIASSIADAIYKTTADVWAAVEVISMLHQRFSGFTSLLTPQLIKSLVPPPPPAPSSDFKEKEELARITKQRSTLRVVIELQLVGIIEEGPENKPLVATILNDLLMTDRTQHANLNLAVAFCKFYYKDFFDLNVDSEKLGISKSTKQAVQEILKKYYDSTKKHLLFEFERVKKTEKANDEMAINRGNVADDRRDLLEKRKKSLERLRTATESLSEILQLEMPILPEEEEQQQMTIEISDLTRVQEENLEIGIWEDEETKSFYENLIDLKNLVPMIFLDSSIGSDATKSEEQKNEEQEDVVPDRESPIDDESVEDDQIEEVLIEETPQEIEENNAEEPSAKFKFDELASKLQTAFNRETIDQLAVEFAYINSKLSRRKISQVLLAISRNRLDSLPYYCRFIATLKPYMPDIAEAVVKGLEVLVRKKNVQHLDPRYCLMIENALHECNPPEVSSIPKKEYSNIELFLMTIILKDLSRATAKKTVQILRKLDWKDTVTIDMLKKLFSEPWNVKFSSISMLSYVISELSPWHPDFGVYIVDQVLEDIRFELEANIFKHNQRRVASAKYLAELYNYRMINSQLYILTKGPLPMDVEFQVSETRELLRPRMILFGTYQEAADELNRRAQEAVVETTEKDEEIDSDQDEQATDLELESNLEISNEQEPESNEEYILDAKLPEGQNENLGPLPEELEDFEKEYAKLIQESLEIRRNDRKVQSFDASIPSKAKSKEDRPETGYVNFTMLTKKGNKAQGRSIALPEQSTLVKSTLSKQKAEVEERLKLKAHILDYEERERHQSGSGAQDSSEPVVIANKEIQSRRYSNRGRGSSKKPEVRRTIWDLEDFV